MYFTPHLDETGVRIPTYEDRLDALTASYQAIFGSDANLEISSPDYQLLSVFARSLDDLSQLILDDFASRNPRYAAGAALDLLLPLMGLTRQGATYSKAILTLTGAPVTILSAAPEVLDDAGHLWRCRSAGILLDTQGKASVEAVCTTPGAVEAPAGSIHRLVSPIAGLASAVTPSLIGILADMWDIRRGMMAIFTLIGLLLLVTGVDLWYAGKKDGRRYGKHLGR